MSESDAVHEHGLHPASVGQRTCINDRCRSAGAVALGPECPMCGQRTYVVPGSPTTAPVAAPVAPSIGAGEILSRLVFGGFWAVVSLVLLLTSLATLVHGHPAGLLGILLAGLFGLYARYIFRGGRFRILFW